MKKQNDLDIPGVMDWLNQEVWDLTRHMAFTALNVMQAETRVRYGRARASWGMGSPTARNRDPGERGPENAISPSEATALAMQSVSNVTRQVPAGGPKRIEVASYVDYMIYLDQGTDYIEPGHMVDKGARAAAEDFGRYTGSI